MSSSVCQGLQSCLELRFVESRFLSPKLAPPVTNFPAAQPCFAAAASASTESEPKPCNEEKKRNLTNPNNGKFDMGGGGGGGGGWSFLQSLANANLNDKVVYVHPLVKRSASTLSEKSLEMCTESLGSETGSQVSDSSYDISLVSLETASKPLENVTVSRKMSRASSFPPPLTSISGSHGVQVKAYREEGRLLFQAVAFPRCHSHFHAERGEGRLRLSLLKEADNCEEEEEEEEEDEDDDECHWREDMEGKCSNFGGEMGKGKMLAMPLPSSCKESGRGHNGLLNLESSFWVAT